MPQSMLETKKNTSTKAKRKRTKTWPTQKPPGNFIKYLDQQIVNFRHQPEKYKTREFKQLKILLVNIYFEKDLTHNFFASLSPHNSSLLNMLVPKIFKINRLRMKLVREVINTIHHKTNNLKPEQKLKLVYRQVFRNMYREFMRHFSKFNPTDLGGDQAAITDCSKKSFYYWLFQDSVRQGKVSLDVVMDVVCNNSWQNKRASKGDWRKIKMEALKQMSAPLRYLISTDLQCKKKILSHFDDPSKKGFIYLAKVKIQNQLVKKFNHWKEILQESKYNFKVFRKKMRDETKNSGTLFPWTLGTVKRAIEFCKEDLEDKYSELHRKFNKMMQVTYSSVEVPEK